MKLFGSGVLAIAAEMVREEGKPLSDARNESGRTPKNLELYAGEAYRLTGATFPSDDTPLVYSTRDPIGVVAEKRAPAVDRLPDAASGRAHPQGQALAFDRVEGGDAAAHGRGANGAGLEAAESAFIIFFPREGPRRERIERRLGRVPLGAQYYVAHTREHG